MKPVDVDEPADRTAAQAAGPAKRDLIRRAAKRLFSEHGLARTSVRDISREAGFTTGALYFHYRDKEALYADILRESLTALHGAHRRRGGRTAQATHRAMRGIPRVRRVLRREPARLEELSLYLMQGARRVGLNAELDRELGSSCCSTRSAFFAVALWR